MSIVIRVFDETGHIGYLGFNDAGPFITNLAKAQEYGDGDFDAAVYDAQRFARENFGVFNTCPVVEAVYLPLPEIVDTAEGTVLVAIACGAYVGMRHWLPSEMVVCDE